MNLRQRIIDVNLLLQHGRIGSALILALVAVAATSRKRYPKPTSDKKAFKQFILDEMATITGGPKYNVAFAFQGKENTPLEDILYYHLRCQLVHEGEMPRSIVFTKPEITDGKKYNILRLNDPLGFPEGWVKNLAVAVMCAPENKDLFPEQHA